MSSADATPADIAAKRAELGLDQPYLIQLGRFMYNAFVKFDLGNSWARGTSVMSSLLERLPRTFMLGFLMIVVTVVIGVPIGIGAAIHRGGWQDRSLMVMSMVFISVPEFWLALMLIIVFSLNLGWLPSFGIESWQCYILPVISGAMAGIANLARQSRASVLEVVRADYITTARAKGMREQLVIYKHMLPNALIPIITISGSLFARCVGGTVVLEKIFSFPGVGLYMTDSIGMRDYPAIRGSVVVLAAFTALLMLIVDLAYGFADPQIKAQYADSAKRKGHRRGHGHDHRHDHGHSGGRRRSFGGKEQHHGAALVSDEERSRENGGEEKDSW
jgi:peptide/nickel transport system permease protein